MRHPDSGFVANLDREQRIRYYEWLRRYLLVSRGAAGFAVVTVVSWILQVTSGPLSLLARAMWKPALLAALFFGLWSAFLDCPRCGEKFNGWFGRGETESSDECQNCGLRKSQLSAIAKPRD